MNRTTLSLIAAAVALAAVTGFASLTGPADSGSTTAAAHVPTQRLPVERTSALCPAPSLSDIAETTYTSVTPQGANGAGGSGGGAAGAAELKATTVAPTDAGPADDGKKKPKSSKAPKAPKAPTEKKPVVALKEPGKPVSGKASGADAPALVGTATGRLAPGWTTQQTTTVDVGGARGLLGVTCTQPDTDFWFPGASTEDARQDYVHLTNPDDTAAVADIQLYGSKGALKSEVGEGIPVPAHSSVPVLLSTLTSEAVADVTVHVTTRTGRVGAVVRAADEKAGSDWLPASADPTGKVVLPGIPADATDVRLVAFAPGQQDADLKMQLAGPSGTIVPAGHETLTVKAGMTASVDLADVTKDEAGSLILSQAQSGPASPVVAALRVVRGKGDKQEIGFIPATGPIATRATVADNRAKGSTLSLTAPGAAAKVKVTASAGTGGGEPAVKTFDIKAGTTQAVTPPVPEGLKGSYALTVEPESGGPVHAARTLALSQDGVSMFTVQTLPDDRSMVSVPKAEQDLSILD